MIDPSVLENLLPEEIAVALHASDMPSEGDVCALHVKDLLAWAHQGIERLGGQEVVQELAVGQARNDVRSALALRAANLLWQLADEPILVINAPVGWGGR